jgi:hypothetical protein
MCGREFFAMFTTPQLSKALEPKMLSKSSDNIDDGVRDIDKLVERWNNHHRRMPRTDLENYLNGDIDLVFEYSVRREPESAPTEHARKTELPYDVPVVAAKVHDRIGMDGTVGRELLDCFSGQVCVLSRWNERTVLVRHIECMNEIEKLVPSLFAVGLEPHYCIEKLWTNPVGQSVLHGFLKPCSGFRDWELDRSPLSVGLGEGEHNGCVSMIERGSQIMDGVAANYSEFLYDGFVFFGSDGTPAGSCICFKDIAEGTLFAQRLVKLSDVFRGPINLAARRRKRIA